MKKLTFKISSLVQTTIILLIFSGFGHVGLHAQNSSTDIVPAGDTVTKLSSNQYQYLEGPVWYNDSVLLFVDDAIGSPNIFQYHPEGKQFSKWPTSSAHLVGLSCDKDGNLIGASSNILMMNKSGQVSKTLASGYNGKPFNNPNDLIADVKGGVYFTDPDYFLTNPPQDKTAVYYIEPDGNVNRIIDDLAKPNGLLLSPDGTKLYVVDGNNNYVYSWDVAPDGSVSGKFNLAELQTTAGNTAGADGMAIDIKGNIYVASKLGIQVFTPQGAAITTIAGPEIPSNCDFGGKDFKTLYITAHHTVNSNLISNLYSINLNFPGFAVSRQPLTTGINSKIKQGYSSIYPNPSNGKFAISTNVPISRIEIYNSLGDRIYSDLNLNQQISKDIDLSNAPKGIYFVKIKSGTQISNKKIVVQ